MNAGYINIIISRPTCDGCVVIDFWELSDGLKYV